jgi:hypothetical protein
MGADMSNQQSTRSNEQPAAQATPWVETIRRDSGLVEHVCEHGVGHPAYGSVHWMEINGMKGYGVHGCDGCCRAPAWVEADLREGLRIANTHLLRVCETHRNTVNEFVK